MASDNGERGRKELKVKPIKGQKAQLKALADIKKLDKQIEKRFKVSEPLLIKREKLKKGLGLDD